MNGQPCRSAATCKYGLVCTFHHVTLAEYSELQASIGAQQSKTLSIWYLLGLADPHNKLRAGKGTLRNITYI